MSINGIQRICSTLLAAAMSMLIVSCGGSDSKNPAEPGGEFRNYTGTALRLPASIQFGAVKSGSQTAALTASLSRAPAAATDPGTDYTSDPVENFSIIEGNAALEVVNLFLCLLDSLSAYENINTGPYTDSFPMDLCQNSRESDGSGNLEHSATVNSFRENNSSAHIIQLWFDDVTEDTGTAESIVGEFVITQGRSDSYPYGLFTFRYSVYTDMNPAVDAEDWQVSIVANATSKLGDNSLPRLEFIFDADYSSMPEPEPPFSMASVTQMTDGNLNSGQSRTRFSSAYYAPDEVEPTAYESNEAAVFDDTVLFSEYRSSGGYNDQRCNSRNTAYEDVWSYNLYYAEDDPVNNRSAGQRVSLGPDDSISFIYTHLAENDRNVIAVDENPVYLTYWGEGQLHGFPFEDWVYKYNLLDGTVLTSDETVPVDYLVKAVEVGEAPAPADLASCAHLDVTSVFSNEGIDPATVASPQAPSVGRDDRPELTP